MLCSLLLLIFLTVFDDHETCSMSQTVSSIFSNLVKFSTFQITFQTICSLFLMILLIVSDDHESCSLSETMSTMFPNLVKSSHTSNNFSNDLFTVSHDIHRFCLLFQIVISILPN